MRCSTATAWCTPAPAAPAPRAGTPLSWPATPNALWCADYKGEFLLGNHRYCYPLTITDFARRYLLACEALVDDAGALRLQRLRAGLPGVWAAARRSAPTTACRSPRRTRSTGSANWPCGGSGWGFSSSGSPRPSRAERAARAAASHAQDGSHATRRRRTCCSSRRASIPSCTATTTSARIRRSTCRPRPVAISRRRAPISGLDELEYPFHDWTAVDHHVRADLLAAAEDQREPGLCGAEGRREAGRRPHLARHLHGLRLGLFRRRDVPARTDR